MGLLTGLFRAARKRTALVQDNDMGRFRDVVKEIVAQKDSLSDEDLAAKVEQLNAMLADLPDTDGKAQLVRYLEDFKAVKSETPEVAENAGTSIADLFEKLDTEAMKDAPEAPVEAAAEEPAAEETVAEAVAEETVAPDSEEPAEDTGAEVTEEDVVKEEVEDTDPEANAEYTLEEIYQFIKKRMAEDAEAEAGEESVAEEVTEEQLGDGACETEEVTQDHAPAVTVTLGNKPAEAGSLAAMFAGIKGGKK